MDPRERRWIDDGFEAIFGPWKPPTLKEETEGRAHRLGSPFGRRPATEYGWGDEDAVYDETSRKDTIMPIEEAMQTELTIMVEPKHLKEEWRLVYERSKVHGTLTTLSIMRAEDAARIPGETESSDFVVKHLGNVLAREAPGCFSDKNRAILTFDSDTGRVKTIQ